MFLVGLTGGIASGKSTVSSMFKNMNCQIIDADEVAGQGKVYDGQNDPFGHCLLFCTEKFVRFGLHNVLFPLGCMET